MAPRGPLHAVKRHPAHSAPRVVCIDDDPLFCTIFEELVGAAGGVWLGAAHTLNDAASLLAHAPDLVLLDLHLPDAAGPALVDQVRACCVGQTVVLTGAEVEEIQHRYDDDVVMISKSDENLEESIESIVRDAFY